MPDDNGLQFERRHLQIQYDIDLYYKALGQRLLILRESGREIDLEVCSEVADYLDTLVSSELKSKERKTPLYIQGDKYQKFIPVIQGDEYQKLINKAISLIMPQMKEAGKIPDNYDPTFVYQFAWDLFIDIHPMGETIREHEEEVRRQAVDTQQIKAQQQSDISSERMPEVPRQSTAADKIISEIPDIETLAECINVEAALDKRKRELGYQEPSVEEQAINFASQLDTLKGCRKVEVAVKHRKEGLKAQGQELVPSISLHVLTDRNGEQVFQETWRDESGMPASRRIGKSLPPDYDFSDKTVSRKAQQLIEHRKSQKSH